MLLSARLGRSGALTALTGLGVTHLARGALTAMPGLLVDTLTLLLAGRLLLRGHGKFQV